MSYDGIVSPDGDRIERTDGPLHVRKFSVEQMDNNVYVIACARTGRALVVDAAARPERLVVETSELDVVAVVQTHGHWDHVRAWTSLADDHGWKIWGHPADGTLFPRTPDRLLQDGQVIELGDLAVEVLHTPGHTPGALQFVVHAPERSHLFSGDSLFPGGPGNTWGDAEAFDQLMTGLEDRIFGSLPDSTWVYPGHGADTTLGIERPHLAEWRARGW